MKLILSQYTQLQTLFRHGQCFTSPLVCMHMCLCTQVHIKSCDLSPHGKVVWLPLNRAAEAFWFHHTPYAPSALLWTWTIWNQINEVESQPDLRELIQTRARICDLGTWLQRSFSNSPTRLPCQFSLSHRRNHYNNPKKLLPGKFFIDW